MNEGRGGKEKRVLFFFFFCKRKLCKESTVSIHLLVIITLLVYLFLSKNGLVSKLLPLQSL